MILEQANYSFNAATKEVTFIAPYDTIELQQIELIVNVTDNVIIYQFNKNAKGGTLAAGVLTLTYDTTAMSNGDILMVIVSIVSTNSGLTDAELRATPVPVSGTINTGLTQPLTDVELRASAVPVSVSTLPLPTGAATESTLGNVQTDTTNIVAKTSSIDASLNEIERTIYTSGDLTDKVIGVGAEISGKIVSLNGINASGTAALSVAVVDSGGAQLLPLQPSDTLNAIDTINNVVHIDDNGGSITVDGVVTVIGAGDATAANQTTEITKLTSIDSKDFATQTTLVTRLSESDFDSKTGSLTETAPASDTASSGLNGRLQRIAQRITSLITSLGSPFQAGGSIGNTAFGVNNAAGASAVNIQDGGNSITIDSTQLPAALVTGRLDVNVGARAVSTPTKTGGNSIITLQSVAASSVLVSSAVDVSTKWKGSLNVFFGRRSATAAGAGVNIYIEGSTFASGDDNWTTLAQYTTGFAAAEAEAVTGTVAAGATVITCASTTNLTAQDYIFIDNGTIANSEWRRIKSISANTSVTIIDALTNAQTGSTMYDSAETYNADLDLSSIMRIRVLVDGSLYTQAFAIKVTSTYLDSIV